MVIFLILISLKIIGVFSTYQLNLPAHFPPETFSTKIGFYLYEAIEKIILWLNRTIGIFPSLLVPLIEKTSTKLFFLKAPFLLVDTVILVVLACLFKRFLARKKVSIFSILTLSLLNFWTIFFFNSQRHSLKEKIYQCLFKPYKLSGEENLIMKSILGIFIFVLLAVFYEKVWLIKRKKWLKKIKKIINLKFVATAVLLFFILLTVNCLGFFIRMSSLENPKWSGYWIWASGEREKENNYLIFKKDFSLLFEPEEVNIFSFCQDRYRLFLNEKYVGESGLISDKNFAYFDNWQVSNYLRRGSNSIRLECYNPHLDTLSLVAKDGGMIFQLEAKGGLLKKRIISDSSWRVTVDGRYQAKVEKVSQVTGFQQFFDSNFVSFSWKKAQVIDRPPLDPWKKLIPRPIPFLQEGKVSPTKILDFGRFEENPKFASSDLAIVIGNGFKFSQKLKKSEVEPLTIIDNKTYLLLDFGRIVVGYPEIFLETTNGATVDIGFAETLKPDGTPDVAKMVSQADRVIAKEGGFSYRWFQRRAFRYAVLIFKDFKSPFSLKQFFVNTVNYPADESEGYFLSSDKSLNEIYQIARYTAKIARQGNFEDCPHREKAQYVGDMRLVSLVNYYNYSDKELIKKGLWEFALSQKSDGFVNAVYPSAANLVIPDYSAQWVTATWEYYLYSGDIDFLKKMYPFLKKQVEGFIEYSDKDGLVRYRPGWWIFIDQGDQELNTDKSISLNLFYLEALKSITKIAKTMGEVEDENRFKFLADKVKNSINLEAWDDNGGLYDDCLLGENPCRHFSRQTNALALVQEIVPSGKIDSVTKNILCSNGLPVIITPYFNSFVAEGLFKNGFGKEATDLIRNYWGGMIKRGATTFWETYDSSTGKEIPVFGESLAHGWSAGPAYLLPKWVLGIVPLEPGFSRFQVKPLFADLDYASGKIPIKKGESVEVRWNQSDKIELTVEYNFSATLEIILPYSDGKRILVAGKEIKDLKPENGLWKITFDKPGSYQIILK